MPRNIESGPASEESEQPISETQAKEHEKSVREELDELSNQPLADMKPEYKEHVKTRVAYLREILEQEDAGKAAKAATERLKAEVELKKAKDEMDNAYGNKIK